MSQANEGIGDGLAILDLGEMMRSGLWLLKRKTYTDLIS